MLRAITDCGWPGWVCILMGIVGVLLGAVGVLLGALKKRTGANVVGALTLGIGVLTAATGWVGKSYDLSRTEEALAHLQPSIAERIRIVGQHEAAMCVDIGVGAGALPLVLGLVAVALGLSVQRPAAPTS